MQVQVRPENVFTMMINGRVHKNMRLESTWEGFMKFVGAGAVVILYDNRGFGQKALDSIFDSRTTDLLLIMASPDLLIPPDSGTQEWVADGH